MVILNCLLADRRRPFVVGVAAAVVALVCPSAATAAASVPAGVVAAPRAAAAAQPGTFVPLAAQRIVDTRSGRGGTAVPASGTRSVAVTGSAGVPTGSVAAVTLAVTVVGEQSGVLVAYPSGTRRPATSNLNFTRGVPVSNQVIVAPGSDGRVSFTNTGSGRVQLIVDVRGYYRAGVATTPGAFVATTPTRVVDTRVGTGGVAAPGAFATATLPITGRAGVPADASAVVLNLTATQPEASGWLSAYPHGKARPPTSTLNFRAHASVPNAVVTALGSGGAIDVYNYARGRTQLVVDVLGYYLGGTPNEPGAFVAGNPTRPYKHRLGPGEAVGMVAGSSGFYSVPATAQAVAVNLTVSAETDSSYATADPDSTSTPTTSTVNYRPGVSIASAAVVRGSHFNAYNRAGSVTAVLDLAGYFLAASVTPGRGGVAGHITYSGGSAPYVGLVEVFDPPPYTGDTFPVGITQTDSAGDYRVYDIAPGPHVVCVPDAATNDGECFRDQVWLCGDACAPPITSTQVAVTGAATTRVDLQLTRR